MSVSDREILALRAGMEEAQRQIEMLWALINGRAATTTVTGGGGLLVKLTSNATGGGWYNGVIWEPPAATPTGSTTLAQAQVGVSGDAILVCNLAEITIGLSHDIKFTAVGGLTPYQFIFPATLVTADDGGIFAAIYATQYGC